MGSALDLRSSSPGSSPGRRETGDTVLCSWARHCTLRTVPRYMLLTTYKRWPGGPRGSCTDFTLLYRHIRARLRLLYIMLMRW